MAIVVQAEQTETTRPIGTPYQNDSAATADVFGATRARSLIDGGRQLQGAGDELQRIVIAQQIEDNERYAKDADNELANRIRLLTTGDGTEQNPGYYSTRGEASIAGYKPTEEAINKARDEIAAGMQNAKARQMFLDSAANRTTRELETMGGHAAKGRNDAALATSIARANEADQDAAAHWNDPAVIARSLGIKASEATAQARMNGLGPEATASLVQAEVSKVYANQIRAAMKVDPDQAQALFEQNKSSIDGDVRADIEGELQTVTIASRSQELAAKYIAEAGGNFEKAREMAQKGESGATEDATVARIEKEQTERRETIRFNISMKAEADRAEAEAIDARALKEAQNIIGATGDIDRATASAAAEEEFADDPKMLKAVREQINAHYIPIENAAQEERAIKASTAAEIDRQQRIAEKAAQEQSDNAIELFRSGVNSGQSLLDLQKQHPAEYEVARKRSDFDDLRAVERAMLEEDATQTDWSYYDKVMAYTPEQLAQPGLLTIASKQLAPAELTQLRNRVEDAVEPAKQKGSVTASEIITATINQLGLTGDDNVEKRGRLQSLINSEIIAAEDAQNGKPLEAAKVQEIVNSVVDPLVIADYGIGFFDAKGRLYDIEVPDADRAAIVQVLTKKNGRPPTEAEIARLYNKNKLGQ